MFIAGAAASDFTTALVGTALGKGTAAAPRGGGGLTAMEPMKAAYTPLLEGTGAVVYGVTP